MARKSKKSKNRSVLDSIGEQKLHPHLARRLYKAKISIIKEMMMLSQIEKEKGKEIISLGVGTPYYTAPKFVHKHVKNSLDNNKNIDKYTYFVGLPSLRKKIAEQASKSLGFKVDKDEIAITPGSMGALFYAILSIVDRNDEVIVPSPYFPSHAEQIAIAQGKLIPVPMSPNDNTVYELNISAIEKAINRKTKAIIINNPHNPTGAVFDKNNLLDLANLLRNKDIYLITDEVYDYLIYDNIPYFNIASVSFLWPKVIRCVSYSKKYGMMGWRVGYIHTAKDLLIHILKLLDSNIVCSPHISQQALLAAISGPQKIVSKYAGYMRKNREKICLHLDNLPDLFKYTKPLGTYYAFPKYFLNISSIDMAKKLLYEAGVVTIPGIGFGKEGEGHLRISFGAEEKKLDEAFSRISKWWKRNARRT